MRTGDSIAALGVLSVSFSGWPAATVFRANEQRHVLTFVRKHCSDQPSYCAGSENRLFHKSPPCKVASR
jgi:hypothetical protein